LFINIKYYFPNDQNNHLYAKKLELAIIWLKNNLDDSKYEIIFRDDFVASFCFVDENDATLFKLVCG